MGVVIGGPKRENGENFKGWTFAGLEQDPRASMKPQRELCAAFQRVALKDGKSVDTGHTRNTLWLSQDDLLQYREYLIKKDQLRGQARLDYLRECGVDFVAKNSGISLDLCNKAMNAFATVNTVSANDQVPLQMAAETPKGPENNGGMR